MLRQDPHARAHTPTHTPSSLECVLTRETIVRVALQQHLLRAPPCRVQWPMLPVYSEFAITTRSSLMRDVTAWYTVPQGSQGVSPVQATHQEENILQLVFQIM